MHRLFQYGAHCLSGRERLAARAERSGMTCDDCFEDWQTLLGYLTDDYSTQERFFRQYYNAFKNRLNEPFRTDGQRKKDPLGYIATRNNATYSSFCTGGRLSAVSVLGTTAIRQNLNMRA